MCSESKHTTSKLLIVFAIAYTAINLFFIIEVVISPLAILLIGGVAEFWIGSGIVLLLIFERTPIKIKTPLDYVLLTFSTPVPYLIFIVGTYFLS